MPGARASSGSLSVFSEEKRENQTSGCAEHNRLLFTLRCFAPFWMGPFLTLEVAANKSEGVFFHPSSNAVNRMCTCFPGLTLFLWLPRFG